jgi:hypothetical protein
MPSLDFKTHLAALVTAGTKTHTIRKCWKRPLKVGKPLMFFTGSRTKACRRLRPNTVCTALTEIAILPERREVRLANGSRYGQTAGRCLTPEEIERLAREDGFANVNAFFQFFLDVHGPELRGQLIEWHAEPESASRSMIGNAEASAGPT